MAYYSSNFLFLQQLLLCFQTCKSNSNGFAFYVLQNMEFANSQINMAKVKRVNLQWFLIIHLAKTKIVDLNYFSRNIRVIGCEYASIESSRPFDRI
jgi:hypothetical protein